MLRRSFLLAAVPALRGARLKITDVRLVRLRVVKEAGSFIDFSGRPRPYRVGGGAYVEVHTDQGLIGIGPTLEASSVEGFKNQLLGKDPFDIEQHAAVLNNGPNRGGASVEIALWDLIGKATNQPLYKLWGGAKDKIIPYASLLAVNTVEERAEMAAGLKSRGWQAIKFRSRFPHHRDDIRLIEAARKAVGDDWIITCDANMATTNFMTQGMHWDFKRAVETAHEYQRLKVYWLEEPLPRYDFDHIAELNRGVNMAIAGGEGNKGLHEFRWLLERGCYDIIQPEVLISGVTECRKAAVLAESMGKLCIPHNGGGNLGTICCFHLVASWPNAPLVELQNEEPVGDYRNGFSIMEDPPLVAKDGTITMPDKPGLGVSIKKDLIL